ncbi:MAG: DNA repair protein RecO [Chitinophagaceae bacterium]|nr:DNA repair protein RecO [Chitinophagaceae bacterium]
MSKMLHKTKGIVLRTVKYGETSLIVTLFTEAFGVQSYIISGVRTHSRKGLGKANFFQPAALLDLVVYHNELKHLNRIREFRWAYLYRHIYSDVLKNSVALYMTELLSRCLRQPEANPSLFRFAESQLCLLDECSSSVMANLPLYFSLHLPQYLGFSLQNNYYDAFPVLDLQEGIFCKEKPSHPHYLEGTEAHYTSLLLSVTHPDLLADISLHRDLRRRLLQHYETYYALHIPEFGSLKTLSVLTQIFEEY